MPHFIAECTTNIREQADLPGLFSKVNEALAATGIFPIGGIRSRAHWLDTWQMAEMLFGLITAHFATLMDSRYLALSFEIDELHPTLNYKQNNVHALFK